MAIKKTKKDPIIPPQLKEQYKEQVRAGLTKAVKVIGPMAGAAVAMFKRKPEEKLEAKGMRQEKRAARKESRASKLTTKASMSTPKAAARKTQRATKLTQKAKGLKTMSQANLKASEEIYKAKSKK